MLPDMPSYGGRPVSSLEFVVNGALDEAMRCMGMKNFDCVIANANIVLRFDPGNDQARVMKRRARDAQDRALSQIDIQ